MSLFPRNFQQEFSPLFRLMDDYANLTHNLPSHPSTSLKSFQPRFDISETKEGYVLHGEVPGIDQKNIDIEWTDGNTLTISGRHEQRYESAPVAEQRKTLEHQPSADELAEPSEQATSTEVAATSSEQQIQKASEAPKYWVSERSVGEFSRSFSFPSRIDQENVKASLKNGVLEIAVPKMSKPTARKINIE